MQYYDIIWSSTHHYNRNIDTRCSLLQENQGIFGHTVLITIKTPESKQISSPDLLLLLWLMRFLNGLDLAKSHSIILVFRRARVSDNVAAIVCAARSLHD